LIANRADPARVVYDCERRVLICNAIAIRIEQANNASFASLLSKRANLVYTNEDLPGCGNS
jgi:hypothetical protein